MRLRSSGGSRRRMLGVLPSVTSSVSQTVSVLTHSEGTLVWNS